jgi:hypothetical protein
VIVIRSAVGEPLDDAETSVSFAWLRNATVMQPRVHANARKRSFVSRITSSSGMPQICSLKISTSMGPR